MSASVQLVGLGPGHPGLITVQAAAAIREADAVRFTGDSEFLHLARLDADVGSFESAEEVIELARSGQRVAVLYPGDPYAFASGSQLAERLQRAGVEFDAIPGLLAETAAPALSGIPLTLEGRAATVGLGLVGGAETVVVRLAGGWLEACVRALLKAGRKPDEPAALVLEPGTTAQRRLAGSLSELPRLAGAERARKDALLVVGPGVEVSERLDGLPRRPLHGRRVLVTRARHQMEPFRGQLVALGASVVEIPTVEVRRLPAGEKVREAIGRLRETSVVVFASANAVEIFFSMLFEAGCDARAFASARLCAIGQETARCLEEHGLRPDMVEGEYTAEGLVEALAGHSLAGARILVPRAQVARDALPALLAQRGADVTLLPVYETVRPAGTEGRLARLFPEGGHPGVDVVSFTSSSTVVNFVRAFSAGALPDALDGARVACMGPVTADSARQLGLRVDIVARDYTTRGLAQAIAEAFA